MVAVMENSTDKIAEPHNSDVVFQNLYPALLQSFAVILIGYISGRFEFIPKSQCGGLGSYVGKVALPALLFQKMASLSFGSIDWLFWSSILLAKGFIFVLVFGLTLLIGGTRSLGRAAIFSMFATQSNDFALGYPPFVAMYKDSYPELPEYLYLFGPISLICLNPFGFLALEMEKNDRTESNSRWIIILKVVKGMLSNPIILSVVVGVAVNLIAHQKVPDIIAPIVQVLSDSFSATALFYLGISLVGTMQNMSGFTWMVPLLLISAKQFLMPLTAVLSVNLLKPGEAFNMTDVYSNYGFLYGTIPTTPSVFLYATHYGVSKDIVSSSLFLCTILSGPAMFVTAIMAMLPSMERSDYEAVLANVSFCISCVGIISSFLLLVFFILRRCIKMFPHKVTVNLVVAQMLACLGVVACFTIDRNSLANHICMSVLLLMGVLASHLWTAALAVALCLLRIRRSSIVQRFSWCFYLYGWGCSICLAIILLVVEWPTIQDDVSFDLKSYQVLVSTIILGLNIFLTVSALVVMWKYDRFRGRESVALNAVNAGPPPETSNMELENFSRNATGGSTQAQKNGLTIALCPQQVPENRQGDVAEAADQSERVDRCFESDGDHHQLGRHLTLLLFLTGCMTVSFVFNIWKQSTWNNHPGTFVQLDFMDKLLTFGQGFATLLIFGLDRQGMFLPAYQLFRRCCQVPETCRRLDEGNVEDAVTLNCQNFMHRYHSACSASIEDGTGKFQGTGLVNWLQEQGLFEDRESAERFADMLQSGGVIQQTEGEGQFFDSRCNYMFVYNDRVLSVT